MGKLTANNVSLYVENAAGASVSISGQGNSIELSYEADEVETTTFGANTRERIPGTLRDWELTFDGFYDSASNQIGQIVYDIHQTAKGATVIQLGIAGSSSGAEKFVASALMTGVTVPMDVEEAVGISLTFTARAGSLTRTTW